MQLALTLLVISTLSIGTYPTRSVGSPRVTTAYKADSQVDKDMDLPQGKPLPEGTWGGVGIQMDVNEDSTSIAFDCADAEIPGKIIVDKNGNFSARGKFNRRHPGPIRPNEPPPVDAKFAGRVSNNRMTLKITLTSDGTAAGEYTLEHGRNARIVRCL